MSSNLASTSVKELADSVFGSGIRVNRSSISGREDVQEEEEMPRYQRHLARLKSFFNTNVPERRELVKRIPSYTNYSPCNNFYLSVYNCSPESNSRSVCAALVRNLKTGYTLLIPRNSHDFPHDWVKKGDRTFLVAAMHRFGLTIIACEENGGVAHHIPMDAMEGHGFRFAGAQISPCENYLIVVGSYTKGPAVRKIYDFRTPLKLPYPLLAEVSVTEEFDIPYQRDKIVQDIWGKSTFTIRYHLSILGDWGMETAESAYSTLKEELQEGDLGADHALYDPDTLCVDVVYLLYVMCNES